MDLSASEKKYTGVDNLEVMEQAQNYNQSLVNSVIKYSGKYERLLDFGAGTGYFAERVRQQKPLLQCIEVDLLLSERLKEKGFSANVSLEALASDSVDFVYSLNVLEHIEDDRNILIQMNRCLIDNGKVYIYVPAFPLLYSSMDKKVGHVRRYKIADFKRLAKQSGFKVIHWSYVDSVGFFLSLLYKRLGSKNGDINPKTIKFYDTFLFPLNRFFDFFFSKVLGKNLEIVLEKL
jgi:SAM-dependent methyltransferase